MSKIGFLFVRAWAFMVSISLWWLLYARSDFYFFLVYHVAHYRRKVVRENLLCSFPEKDLKEIKAIEKRFYHNLCDLAVETFKVKRMTTDDIKKHVFVTNPELVDALSDKQKSFFFAIPHSGNWEWFGKWMTTLAGYRHEAIYKQAHNPDFDRYILDLRTQMPVEMLESNVAFRALAKQSDTKNAVLILADQSSFGNESDYWNVFLNQETCWFTGLERMSKFLDYAVVFVDMRRVGRGQYEVTLHTITETPKETEKGYIMEQYSQHIERFIKANPDNWLWSHKRWKHKRNQGVEQ